MSPDENIERLLRDARAALPEPARTVTENARTLAVAAARRRPRRLRVAALSVGFVVALALGGTIGALVVPRGEAAKEAVGLGFIPEPGWTAFQTGWEASPPFQTVAVAANVPLARDDVRAGAAEASGLPYTTLQELPSNGIVIAATFTRYDHNSSPAPPERKLPLTLADAIPFVQYGTQVRPEEPLGQWEIRAVVNEKYVDTVVYFGTSNPSAAMREAANRQLASLVVLPKSSAGTSAAGSSQSALSGSRVVDRTVSCPVGLIGGLHKIQVSANTGTRLFGKPNVWKYLASAGVGTWANSGGAGWVEAGNPLESGTAPERLGVNADDCRTAARIPLSKRGLAPTSVSTLPANPGEGAQCFPGRRVLVRVRGVFAAPTTLRVKRYSGGQTQLVASGTVQQGSLAVRTSAGKPLAYAEVFANGKAKLWLAQSCEG